MNVKLAKLIVEKGYISLDNLKTAVEEQKNTDKSLGIILIDHGFITEQQLLDITNYENEYEIADLKSVDISEDVIKLVPADKLKDNNIMPFELNGSFLSVAMLDPSNIVLIDELRFLTGYNIKPYITLFSGITHALNKYYNTDFDKESKTESIDPGYDDKNKVDHSYVAAKDAAQSGPDKGNKLEVDFNSAVTGMNTGEKLDQEQKITADFIDQKSFDTTDDLKKEAQLSEEPEKPTDENQRKLDKIDIFNLSPDEIEESKSFRSNVSKDADDTKNETDIGLFQSPVAGKDNDTEPKMQDVSTTPATKSDDIFQTPTEVQTSADDVEENVFKAPAKEIPSDASQNLFMTPGVSDEDSFSEPKTPEKEFGIPFTFTQEENAPDLEPEQIEDQNVRGVVSGENQIDPFMAFSGNKQESSEPVTDENQFSLNAEDNPEKLKEEASEVIQAAPKIEIHDVVEPSSAGIDIQYVFVSAVASQHQEDAVSKAIFEEKGTVQQPQEQAEFNVPAIDPELNSINVDTSYDNIESLNRDLDQTDLIQDQSNSSETAPVVDRAVNNSQNNGSGFAESEPESEKILQLEDESLEQEKGIVRPTVLVVDDSPTVQKIVSVTLNRRGYNVEVSSNAMQALAKLNDCIPDIIFLDINLPHMDGYQLCKVIKSNELTKAIPVVMLSGKDGFFDKMRGKMVGATDYITKPFEPNTLVSALEKQGITIARTN